MIKKSVRERLVLLFAIAAISMIAGCAGTPQSEDGQGSVPIFYPSAPDSPRIQFLTSFSGAQDIDTKKQTSFARFILGEEKKAIPQLNKPYGVALFENKIYAIDTRGSGYVIFDLGMKTFRRVLGMKKPINITIDRDGTKYVTDTDLKKVFVFDRNDKKIQAFGGEGEFKPTDVAISGNKLFVSDLGNQQILVLDKATGQQIFSIGTVGSAEGQLFHPTNLAIGSNGNLYVSDTGNFRVQEFTPDGRFVRTFGEIGVSYGKFARPKGIALDKEGRIYVVDAAYQNIQVFDDQGQLLMFFAGPGAGVGPGQLYLPTDISINYESVSYFQSYAEPGFQLEYVILVANQYGPHKISVYGFGKMQGMPYP